MRRTKSRRNHSSCQVRKSRSAFPQGQGYISQETSRNLLAIPRRRSSDKKKDDVMIRYCISIDTLLDVEYIWFHGKAFQHFSDHFPGLTVAGTVKNGYSHGITVLMEVKAIREDHFQTVDRRFRKWFALQRHGLMLASPNSHSNKAHPSCNRQNRERHRQASGPSPSRAD